MLLHRRMTHVVAARELRHRLLLEKRACEDVATCGIAQGSEDPVSVSGADQERTSPRNDTMDGIRAAGFIIGVA